MIRLATRPVAVRRGDVLVVLKGAALPHVCVKCSSRADVVGVRRRFSHAPGWIWATLFIGLIWPIVLAAFLRKTGEADVPLCPPCRARWTRARRLATLAALWIPVALGLMIVAMAQGSYLLALLCFVALVAVPVVVELAIVRPHTLVAAGMDDHWMWLKGVHEGAWDGLLQLPTSGEPLNTTLVER